MEASCLTAWIPAAFIVTALSQQSLTYASRSCVKLFDTASLYLPLSLVKWNFLCYKDLWIGLRHCPADLHWDLAWFPRDPRLRWVVFHQAMESGVTASAYLHDCRENFLPQWQELKNSSSMSTWVAGCSCSELFSSWHCHLEFWTQCTSLVEAAYCKHFAGKRQ